MEENFNVDAHIKALMIEACIRDTKAELEAANVPKNDITIILCEIKQDICSVVNGVLLFNN